MMNETNLEFAWPVIRSSGGAFFIALMLACNVAAETPGERFEKFMKEKAVYCARHKMLKGETTCDILKLKPTDPLITSEGRRAHEIVIPRTNTQSASYVDGMKSEEYFKNLCDKEAGEFVYRTVTSVDGVVELRPRTRATDYELQHLFALEDPYGEVSGEHWNPADSFVQPYLGKYRYFEGRILKENSAGKSEEYRRYYRDERFKSERIFQTIINGKSVFVPYIVKEEVINKFSARYGFTWRGISRPHDRELGIAGGELILMDARTGEVLAVRRGFIRTGGMRGTGGGVWWLGGETCPALSNKRNLQFINEVLRP